MATLFAEILGIDDQAALAPKEFELKFANRGIWHHVKGVTQRSFD
jgi:hypothetical protein